MVAISTTGHPPEQQSEAHLPPPTALPGDGNGEISVEPNGVVIALAAFLCAYGGALGGNLHSS